VGKSLSTSRKLKGQEDKAKMAAGGEAFELIIIGWGRING